MKRISLLGSFALALVVALAVSAPRAQGRGSVPTPTPPVVAPTASPEPPAIAIPRLQAKLKANPNDQQSMTELASEFLQIGHPELAYPLTQRLLRTGDKTAQVYYYDATALVALGQVRGAIADLENASNLDPTNIGVLGQLSDLYSRTNRPADAERIAKRAVMFNKTDPRAFETLGAVYGNEQKFDDARTQFELAAKLDPKNPDPILQIANSYAVQNNIPAALQAVERVLAIDPRNTQALVFKADLYAKQHDDTRVSQAYDDAVISAPTADEKVAILTRKAGYYVQSKKYSQAEAVFTQMIAAYPQIAQAHLGYGDYLASQRQLGHAEQEYRSALAINQNLAGALLRMGQLRLQQGRGSDAVTYLKHYVSVNPDAQGYAMLGQAYQFVHDYNRSRDACARSFQIQRTPDTLGCIAGADFELKKYKEGAAIFDALDSAARGFLQSNPSLLFIAAKCYEHTNQKTKAVAAYRQLLPLMRKGTKEYRQVQQSLADLSR